MVKNYQCVSAFIIACLCILGVQAQTFELREGWECQSSAVVGTDAATLSAGGHSSASWYATHVPSTVMGTLVENGEYPCDFDLLSKIVKDISYNNCVKYFNFPVDEY